MIQSSHKSITSKVKKLRNLLEKPRHSQFGYAVEYFMNVLVIKTLHNAQVRQDVHTLNDLYIDVYSCDSLHLIICKTRCFILLKLYGFFRQMITIEFF